MPKKEWTRASMAVVGHIALQLSIIFTDFQQLQNNDICILRATAIPLAFEPYLPQFWSQVRAAIRPSLAQPGTLSTQQPVGIMALTPFALCLTGWVPVLCCLMSTDFQTLPFIYFSVVSKFSHFYSMLDGSKYPNV